jgi:hypothetical protein
VKIQFANSNYKITYVPAKLEITKRAITVTTNPGQTKVYGTSDPVPFTYTVSGSGLATGDV